MQPESWLFVGVALGAVPVDKLARVLVAFLAKRLVVSPKEVEEFNDASDGDGS